MKPVVPAMLMSSLLVFSCQKDNIVTVDTPFGSTGGQDVSAGIAVDCADLNSDIAVLQALYVEAISGGCVTGVEGTTVSFYSGTTVTVAVRESYGLGYASPMVSISGKYWALDGASQEYEVSSALLQIRGEDSVWSCSFDGGVTWGFYSDIESGEDTPVFSAFEAGEEELKVTLGSGVIFSFEYLEED